MGIKSKQIRDVKKRIEHDLVAMGIAFAAILMFIGTGGSVLPKIFRSWMSNGPGPDMLLVNALLLNIALIIFGMRRYRELISEISVRTKAEETARMLSDTDPLTNCLNRRSIEPATNLMIAEATAENMAVAFFMIDLDNFKQVNDLYGHRIGDQVLITAAERARSVLPAGALLARLGGDEFACVVPYEKGSYGKSMPELIDNLAQRLVAEISRPQTVDGFSIEITMSIGIVANSDEDDAADHIADSEVLLHRADIAMYHAKKHGKNRCSWFETTMENELRLRNELEMGIRRGLQNDEFIPYYEQQVDLETNQLVGFEMLARWQSPELGMISPTIFIPVAEEIGVIAELSEGLIEKTLIDAKRWDPKLTVSVNISPVQLRDPWFAQKLLKMLVKHNFPPQRLEIEITESCLHENVAVVKTLITSLKNQGVRISLDDFGTGYSSLTQLRTIPFDRIKIDRSFVTDLHQSDDAENIIDAIISLGEGLKMPITAEGIEDDAVLDALRSKGKIKGQGYLYGQPEAAAQVQTRLNKLGLLVSSDVAGSNLAYGYRADGDGAGEPDQGRPQRRAHRPANAPSTPRQREA